MAESSINFIFQEKKATQAAARIIRSKGGQCDYLYLVKLLYIVDREAIKSWERAVSGGPYFSLRHGPVNSSIMDLANEKLVSSHWKDSIQKNGNDVLLQSDPGEDELSEAEKDLIDYVFEEYGHHSPGALRYLTHQFPEWQDPGTSRLPITGEAILRAVGRSDEEISDLSADLSETTRLRGLLQR